MVVFHLFVNVFHLLGFFPFLLCKTFPGVARHQVRQKTWNNFMPSILNFPPSLFLKSATVLTIVRATIQYSTHVPSSPLRIGDIHCDCEQRKKTKNATKPKFKSDYNFSHRYICTTLYYAINTIDPTEDLPSFSTWITEQRS